MKKLVIVKIGGKVIDDDLSLAQFLRDFASIEGDKILVHGGGKIASDIGEKLGIKPNMVEGRRITDGPTLELVTMVYGGLVNKRIVSGLQALDEDAIGLTGADGNILTAVKRPVGAIDYGFAGDISIGSVNVKRLSQLMANGMTPVLCALTHDGKGNLLNTNADTIAGIIASALANQYETRLIYCFEQKGVLSDFENQVVIEQLSKSTYDSLKSDGTINQGMIPKMDNAFNALDEGVKEVRIGYFSDLKALVGNENAGTLIKLN